MLNKIIIMGRLGKDPELRHTQSGTPVASIPREAATSRAVIPPKTATSSPAIAVGILAVTAARPTRGLQAIRPLTITASKKPKKMTVICRSDSNRPLHRRAGRPVLKGVNRYGERTAYQYELLG